MIPAADCGTQAQVLRRTANESPVGPVRGRLIILARELEFAAETCVGGRVIYPASLVARGFRLHAREGSGLVAQTYVGKKDGTFGFRLVLDEPDPMSGEVDMFVEFQSGASPCVVEEPS